MVIFHSYVSLPEGMGCYTIDFPCYFLWYSITYAIFHRFSPFGGYTILPILLSSAAALPSEERWSALPHEFRTLQLGEVGHRTGFRRPVVMFSKPDSHPDLYQGFMKND
jgi:hypothetical protein